MKISFPTSTRNNSGILYQCKHSSATFLINCGIDFSRPGSEEKQADVISNSGNQPDFIVLASGKADHCSLIPLLIRNGFTGPIYGTKATIMMATLTLKEMAQLSEDNSSWLHKNGRRLGLLVSEPLFTSQEANTLSGQMVEVKDCNWTSVTPSLKMSIQETEGIIQDIVRIHATDEEKVTTITTTGTLVEKHLLNPKSTSLSDSSSVDNILLYDCSMSEQTSSFTSTITNCFKSKLQRAQKYDGKLFIVVSSASEYIEALSALENSLDTESDMAIYLDSPVAESVLNEASNSKLQASFLSTIVPLSTSDESKKLNDKDTGFIVLTSNAVEGGGRLAHHLKHNLWAKENQFILCYKTTPNTLSAQLVDTPKSLWLFGCRVLFNSDLVAIEDLFPKEKTATSLPGNLTSIFLTFENENFVFGIEEDLGNQTSVNSYIPLPGDTISIGEGKSSSTLRTVYEEPTAFYSAVENDLAIELTDFQRAVEEAGYKLDALTGELALWANKKTDSIEAVSGCSKVVKLIIDCLSSLGTEGIAKAEGTIAELATRLGGNDGSKNSEALAALNMVRSTITDSSEPVENDINNVKSGK